ncbi:hypothetical protein [uncultured Pantoea sp.]|uniref:hypothetical protein n=1 Tax=uncultured Pantoea sp. TaxID=218084 RepID=UPI002585EAD0|nr:hypothetical protein [uncultured Pantoea sp.]
MRSEQKQDEIQRRTAACVNAFEGIPTERIAGKNLGEILAGEMRLHGAGPRADGGFGFEFSGGVCQLLADAYAEQFKQSGAINYLELLFQHSEIGPLTITMQRVEGLTPAQKLAQAEAQRNVLAAENAILKSGIGFFSYGTDSGFEEHDSAEKAIAAADSDIDYYRGDACDGWSEETDQTVWGVIMQRATMINERPRSEEFPEGSCDYALLPNLATPATDAYLNSLRAEGVEILTGKLQQLIDEGVFDAKEIGVAAGAVYEGAQIVAELRAGKDGE